MDQLIKNKKIDLLKLRRLFLTLSAKELSKLAEPCYYPKLKINFYSLLKICGITEKELKSYVKRFYEGTPAASWKLQNDIQANLLIVIMHLFLINKDQTGFSSAMIYHLIRYYTNLMNRSIPHCNPDYFRYALEVLNKTHLFSREKTIPGSLFYLAKEMEKAHREDILDGDVDKISLFITKSRHRVAQSVRSFAKTYYAAAADSAKIIKQKEESDDGENAYQLQVLERGKKIIDETVKRITVYKTIDKKALADAKNLTKIKTSLATIISDKLTNSIYSEDIRNILHLFVKDLKNVNSLCGSKFYIYVKSLMGIKRTSAKIYYKQQINLLLIKILKDIKYYNEYIKMNNQTQFAINSYLSFYITITMRNIIC